jgi:hypothetical protein
MDDDMKQGTNDWFNDQCDLLYMLQKLLSCSEEGLNVFHDHADKYNSQPCTAYLIFSIIHVCRNYDPVPLISDQPS